MREAATSSYIARRNRVQTCWTPSFSVAVIRTAVSISSAATKRPVRAKAAARIAWTRKKTGGLNPRKCFAILTASADASTTASLRFSSSATLL